MKSLRTIAFILALFAPSLAFGANCVSGSIITSHGAYACTVPALVTSMTFKVWAASGGGSTNGSTGAGGGGGGACSATITVTPSSTIYGQVGTYGGADLVGTGAGSGSASWLSTVNSPPSSGQGVNASGGNGGKANTLTPGVGGGGSLGTCFTGGTGNTNPGDSPGGGGAGTSGNGGNGTGGGGAGGAGGGGQGGDAYFSVTPTQPGGAGGGDGINIDSAQDGADGQIQITFTAATASTPFIFIPAVIP